MIWKFSNQLLQVGTIVFFGLFGTFPLNALAQEEPPERISVTKVAAYIPVLPVLQKVVRRANEEWLNKEATRAENHLYVCRVSRWKDGVHSTWVYWKEARALILWEPGLTYERREDELWLSRRFLSLDKHVVATPEAIGGNNFLMDKQWADEKVADCIRNGDLFVVVKKAR